MRVRLIAGLLTIGLPGCGPQVVLNNMAAPAAGTNGAAAAPTGPTGEAGFRAYAECAATFEAVANFFEAAASQQSGAQAEDARNTATQRRSAALAALDRARDIAMQIGRTPEDFEAIKTERRTALERERARQDFGDFAIWLGRESDRCQQLDPSLR